MNNIKSFQEIQGFLSVGYIYLIVLGILNETLYYNQIGINILNYSSILDVLISPIANLTSSILSLCIFIVLIFLVIKLPGFLAKNKDRNWSKKVLKIDPDLSANEIESSFFKVFLIMISVGLLGFFVGTGITKGIYTSKRINEGEIEYNDKLNLINGENADIKILGTNSSFIFYLTPEIKTVSITPIEGIVESIVDSK
ncbi:hypothetical protein RM549_05160 [Salegentibacter sp. F188]|uniref:Uncharacterized protein n=1 Tax=Autumnicola patrickiae TaxID=3075591 RepID=A0ABU3DZN6_9FLAO|nr:hypothetical protein [Salegentibacter sp. F188]MDT0689162.1 hypothetical protein [Salegentibacter sp. F188]